MDHLFLEEPNQYDAQKRILDIISLSSQKPILEKKELAQRYATSIRTIERDLEKLVEFGFKIEKITQSCFKLLVGSDNPMVSAAIKQFAQKSDMADLFPSLETRFLKKLIEGEYDEVINVNTGHHHHSSYENQLFPKLIRAVSNQNILSFNYSGKLREEVKPYRLSHYGGIWYLLAKDHQLKTFTISKISKLRIENTHFEKELHLEQEVKAMSCAQSPLWYGKSEIKFKLLVSAEVNGYFKSRKFFPNQRLASANLDGSIVLEVVAHHKQAVIPQVLSWMPHIEIIEPVQCREEVEEILKGYLNQTKKKSCIDI